MNYKSTKGTTGPSISYNAMYKCVTVWYDRDTAVLEILAKEIPNEVLESNDMDYLFEYVMENYSSEIAERIDEYENRDLSYQDDLWGCNPN